MCISLQFPFALGFCRILREQKIRLGENTATTSVVKRMSHERSATRANCRRKNARAQTAKDARESASGDIPDKARSKGREIDESLRYRDFD